MRGAPVLLFVHGFPEFWYEWKDQLAAFSRDHLTVAPDLRGYNLSSKPAEVKAYRAKHLVEDLRLLIDALRGKPCVLVANKDGLVAIVPKMVIDATGVPEIGAQIALRSLLAGKPR